MGSLNQQVAFSDNLNIFVFLGDNGADGATASQGEYNKYCNAAQAAKTPNHLSPDSELKLVTHTLPI